jgi:hypothetical protein
MTVDELIAELMKAKEQGVLGTDPIDVFLGASSGFTDLKIHNVFGINTHEVAGKGGSFTITLGQT